MVRCIVCGFYCDGKTIGHYDKEFLPHKENPLCPKCFKAWTTGDKTYLFDRIREKLTLGENTKNIRLNEDVNER